MKTVMLERLLEMEREFPVVFEEPTFPITEHQDPFCAEERDEDAPLL